MTISEHLTQFAGKPVADWEPDSPLADPEGTLYRLSLSYEEADAGTRWIDTFARLLDDPVAGRLRGLVVGIWFNLTQETDATSEPVVEALVAAREQLPNLTTLFLGDIIVEESEISWINQSDVSPLFDAYPRLEHFGVRGGDGLVLGRLRHERLRSLVVETGGLDVSVVRDICAAELPALEHLELWLGDEYYGANTTVDDLAPILSGTLFPKLRYLGLRDSEIADEIAAAVATAPVLERLRVLDLSLGTLGDEGAAALLAAPAVARLEKLDIHHHYCSDEMVAQLTALGIEVDVSERQTEEDYDGERYRYVAVSE